MKPLRDTGFEAPRDNVQLAGILIAMLTILAFVGDAGFALDLVLNGATASMPIITWVELSILVPVHVLTFAGAYSMICRNRRWLCLIASVFCSIPFLTPLFLVGLPLGWGALYFNLTSWTPRRSSNDG